MKWMEITIHSTQEAVEPISAILHDEGASGVVIEDPAELSKERENVYGEIYSLNPADYPKEGVLIKAYLPANNLFQQALHVIKNKINTLREYDIDIGHNIINVNEVHEEEWANAWKKYYHPVKISEKITIVPTWEEYEPISDDEIMIELDPGMAFGTGTHPTTVLCIQALEKVVKQEDHVIDVGTGSGVLSIASAKLGAGHVDAYDLDEVAVNSALMNVKLNKVDEIVTVKQNNLLDNVVGQVDIIVANILAEIILLFIDAAANNLKKGGLFITSGIIKNKKDIVLEEIKKAGFDIIETKQLDDWVVIVGRFV